MTGRRCRACGRQLRTPDSALRGIGPVCARNLRGPTTPAPRGTGSDPPPIPAGQLAIPIQLTIT
ncbi:DUF6011 domain-containing protein [Yinghuangia aomiensis]